MEPLPAHPTVPVWFRGLAERLGDRELIVADGARLTYAEANARSARLARALLEAGAGKGTRIAICFPNGPDWVIAWLATTRIGAVAVPLNTFFKARELGCITGPIAGSFIDSYNLTGGLARNGFPLSPIRSFGSNGGRPYVVTERNVYDYFPENQQPWTWPGRLIGTDYLASKGLSPARSKPREAKCVCSGGPGCGQIIIEDVDDDPEHADHR